MTEQIATDCVYPDVFMGFFDKRTFELRQELEIQIANPELMNHKQGNRRERVRDCWSTNVIVMDHG